METENERRSRRWNELADTIAEGRPVEALNLLHELRPQDVPQPGHVIRRIADRTAQTLSHSR